ncbi:hypothetical protein KA005_66330, partial [bacterium]|nr:hypothetical protein [bacterium]
NVLDEINNVRAQIHKILGQSTWIDTPAISILTIKSKLDTIESGATADQSASEIRTLIESATNSNVFTDAEKTIIDNTSGANSGDQTLRTDATLPFTDVTTNDASTAKHGFLPKLDNVMTNFMNGQGGWSAAEMSENMLIDARLLTHPFIHGFYDSDGFTSSNGGLTGDHLYISYNSGGDTIAHFSGFVQLTKNYDLTNVNLIKVDFSASSSYGFKIQIVGETTRPYRMQTKRGSFKETNTTITTIYYKEIQ